MLPAPVSEAELAPLVGDAPEELAPLLTGVVTPPTTRYVEPSLVTVDGMLVPLAELPPELELGAEVGAEEEAPLEPAPAAPPVDDASELVAALVVDPDAPLLAAASVPEAAEEAEDMALPEVLALPDDAEEPVGTPPTITPVPPEPDVELAEEVAFAAVLEPDIVELAAVLPPDIDEVPLGTTTTVVPATLPLDDRELLVGAAAADAFDDEEEPLPDGATMTVVPIADAVVEDAMLPAPLEPLDSTEEEEPPEGATITVVPAADAEEPVPVEVETPLPLV